MYDYDIFVKMNSQYLLSITAAFYLLIKTKISVYQVKFHLYWNLKFLHATDFVYSP